MNDVVSGVAETCAVRAELERLYDAGLYRQALAAGEAAWGPVRRWRDLDRRLLGSRIISQLGLYRTAAALVLDSWRREARDADLVFAYVRTLYNLRGPYPARQALLHWQGRVERSAAQQASWLGLAAVIHGAYRDWEQAHACVDEAMQLAECPEDFLFERAWLYECQDRYDDALATLARIPATTPNRERYLVQCRSRLLEITGQDAQMLDELRAAFARCESVELGMRLHQKLTDRDLLDEADACLARLGTLVPAGEKLVAEEVAIATASLRYRRGDIAGTLAALEPVRGYYFREVRRALAVATEDTPRRLLDVPFIRQHHMTCAPATLTAIWRWHGVHIDHLTLAEAICYDGTSDLAERRWAVQQGWAVREFELNLDDVCTLIDAGCPVALATVEPGSAHLQAIIGYDLRKRIYLLRDPYYPAVQEMLIDGAHEVYAASGPRCMVAVPPQRRDWLQALPLRAATLYDAYFDLQDALDSHRREAALAALDSLREKVPEHRLTHWGARSIARYDNDLQGQLAATDALLALFPQDLNLLAARARLLGDLGKQAERLDFLQGIVRDGQRHPFLLMALVEQLAQDNRREAETRELIDVILRRQPLNAGAWWTLAGVHWDRLEREQAFDCYRLCLCIEDKVEGYATSYFKAARFLRRSDEALDMLRRRIDWLGARSANPYITYARALELLDRGPESLAVLEQALLRHPDNDWLVAEAFDLHMSAGHHQQAESLLAAKGPVLSAALRLQKQARLAEFRADRDSELAAWRELLALQPRNEQAVTQVARLLAEGGRVDEALAFLDSHLAVNPHNLWLLHEKLRYVRQLPLEARRAHLEPMQALHPDDLRVRVAMARQCRAEGDAAAALALLQQAVHIDPDEAWVHLELGDVCMDLARPAEARAAYEAAIRIAVDSDGAFGRLLATYSAFDDKRRALEFIHRELMQQVSFGNGILEFQQLARRYLPDAQVKDFLALAVAERSDLWQSWVAAARFALETDDLAAARDLLDAGIERFPLLPRLWLERAEVRRLRDDLGGAESDLRAAIAINPHYATAITRLADVLEMQGNQGEALKVLRRALQLAPSHAPYAGYCADLLWRMGEREAAWSTMHDALALSPDYGWGWGQLRAWSETLDRLSEAGVLLQKLTVRFPDSVELWQRRAEFASAFDERKDCLERALALAPQRSDTLQSMCDLLVEADRLSEARVLLADTYPEGSEKPSEIRTYEAWLTWRTGRLKAAIAELQAVVADDPGHYNAWRLLARWQHQDGNGSECCRCARQCVALYPQDAGVLVTAAEFLLAHLEAAGPDAQQVRAEIRGWLERACALDHTNMYNALTLADLYLDDGLLDECGAFFARGTLDAQDRFLQARQLRLDVLQGRLAPAVARWREFLGESTHEWLLMAPYGWLVDAGHKDAADECLQALAAQPEPNPAAARAWVQGQLAAAPDGQRLLAALRGIRGKTAFWAEAVHYLLMQAKVGDAELAPLFWQAHDDIESHPQTWAALVAYRSDREDWRQLRRLGARAAELPAAPARALYFCSIGWRFTGDWAPALRLVADAGARPQDDSHDNLRFWQQFDAWLEAPSQLSLAVLEGLDLRELSRLEQLLLQLLQALHGMPAHIGSADVARLEAQWREACRSLPGVAANGIARQATARVRRQLRARVHSGLWPQLWTQLRLLFSLRVPA